MSIVSVRRERFQIDIRYTKNQKFLGEKRKYIRDVMQQDEQFQMHQTYDFLSSKLQDESHWQKEHICQYITQNLYLNQFSMEFDWTIEIKIYRLLTQSPNLLHNNFMYDLLLRCFYNVRNKLNFEDMDWIASLMIQKLSHQEYIQSTLDILLRLTNSYELVSFLKAISQQKYVSILMQLNDLDILKVLSNIVCENYFDNLNIEELIDYFMKHIDNYNAIEALATISDDERYIVYLNRYFYVFQEDDDRMVIVINFFNHYITSIDQLIQNLLIILKQTTNRAAQFKICGLIRKHQIGSTFDPVIQHLLWQNKGYLEYLANDENLTEEVRDLLNQISEYLELAQE